MKERRNGKWTMFLSALLVCLVSFSAHAETVVNGSELETPVSGVVLDATGQPVVGAFVLQKGTSNGTMTDLDGNFTIDVPSCLNLTLILL